VAFLFFLLLPVSFRLPHHSFSLPLSMMIQPSAGSQNLQMYQNAVSLVPTPHTGSPVAVGQWMTPSPSLSPLATMASVVMWATYHLT